MGSVLPASFLSTASSLTTGERFSWSKQCTKNCYAISYVTTLWHQTMKIEKGYCVMMSSGHNLKRNGGSTIFKECKKKYIVNATSEQSFEYEPTQARDPKSNWDAVKDALDAFYTFTRPYAAIGAVLCSSSASLLAVEKFSDLSLPFFIGWFEVVVATFIMHIFNCGLNQLCDLEIDKINKPYLPLASSGLSFRTGVIIVVSSLILSFWLGWIVGSWPLFWVIFSNFVFSAAYSINLPLLRWKKSPVLTAMNFIADGAVARPLGYFLHMQTHVFKRPATFPRPLIFCTAILSVFYVVVALVKDIPDIEGDKKFGIQTLASRLGEKQVFWISISLLQMVYGVTILVGATSPFLWSKISTGLGHAILASVLWDHAKSVDLKSNVALQSFYMFIWKLLSAEYFLIPLFR